jgi:hypothetical protein
VSWTGYPDSDNQWISWDNAIGAEEVIREFKIQNPNRKVHIKVSQINKYPSFPTRISSMFASFKPQLTVTYAINNNVNDATCHEGCISPGINSDTLEQMTTLRDVEEAKAHFPTPEPRRLSNNSADGPIVMEIDGRELVPRPTEQGLVTADGEE